MTRPTLYPEDPAPRGLDGQEFAALWTREGSPVIVVLQSRHNTASPTGSEFRENKCKRDYQYFLPKNELTNAPKSMITPKYR